MLSLTIKDIRDALEEILRKHYAFADYTVTPTKVIDKDKEFRIEFKIYDAGFRMVIDPSISGIYIGTKSFGEPDHVDSIMIWLEKPYQYDTKTFDFGWRKDLESFFDALQAYLVERVEKMHNPPADKAAEPNIKIGPFKEDQLMKYLEEEEAASYEEYIADAKVDESKIGECKIADKTSIFNNLKDDEDEYI